MSCMHSMQFDLPDDARSCVKKVSVVRNLCHKVFIHSIIYLQSTSFLIWLQCLGCAYLWKKYDDGILAELS